MPTTRIVLALLLFLFLPRLSIAEPFVYPSTLSYFNTNSYGSADADETVGGRFTLFEQGGDGHQVDVQGYHVLDGYIDLVSGPFVREVGYEWGGVASYAAGGTVTASWTIVAVADYPWWSEEPYVGATRVIDFTARLGAFDVTYDFSVLEYGDGGGRAIVPFTYWQIDRDDAKFLGLPYHRGQSGTWDMCLDYHAGGPDVDLQHFASYCGFEAEVVPEPALAALLLAGLGASLRRWRRSRRASRSNFNNI